MEMILGWIWTGLGIMNAVGLLLAVGHAIFDRREDPRYAGAKLWYRP